MERIFIVKAVHTAWALSFKILLRTGSEIRVDPKNGRNPRKLVNRETGGAGCPMWSLSMKVSDVQAYQLIWEPRVGTSTPSIKAL
jgi:hypothetical protein